MFKCATCKDSVQELVLISDGVSTTLQCDHCKNVYLKFPVDLTSLTGLLKVETSTRKKKGE
jgi:hypothetical protein